MTPEGTTAPEDAEHAVDCRQALSRLFEFLDEEIDEADGDAIRQHLRAVGLVRLSAAHRATSWPRRKPRSRAVSVRMSRSWRRPRCNRDITVPIGVPMISAISL